VFSEAIELIQTLKGLLPGKPTTVGLQRVPLTTAWRPRPVNVIGRTSAPMKSSWG